MGANLILTQTQQLTVQTINIAAMFLAVVLHHFEYTRNPTGSGILLFYWLFTTLVNGYRLWVGGNIDTQHFGLFTTTYVLSCLMFILESCKRPSKQAIQLRDDNERLCPVSTSNIFGKLAFNWMNPWIQFSSMNRWWNIENNVSAKFEKRWTEELQKSNPSLLRTLMLTYPIMGQLLIGGLLKLLHDTVQFAQPLLLGILMEWVSGHTALTQQIPEPLYKGVSIAFCMFAVSVLRSLLLQQFLYRTTVGSSRLRSALVNAVCRKSLHVSSTPEVKQMAHIIKKDVPILVSLFQHIHSGWSFALQVSLGLILLYQSHGFLGWSGMSVMLLSIPVQLLFQRWLRRYRKAYDESQHRRLCAMRNILDGIHTIKLYAWEIPFMNKVVDMQNSGELGALRRIGAIATAKDSLLSKEYLPFTAAVVTFLAKTLIQQQQPSIEAMLVTLVIFDLLQKPFSNLAKFSELLIRSGNALHQLQTFLSQPEISPVVQNDIQLPNAPLIETHQAAFAPALQSVDLSIRKGELIGIVGSNPSALIHAILGQLPKTQGKMTLRGSIAYVSRNPWIFNSNLQDNIVFGQPWDPLFYRNVLDLCEISEEQSLDSQKARVSLARALYSRADIYLLDDPFRHMTPQLARRLFHRVIQGHLRNKARIMVTHTFSCLHQLQRIVMFWDGEVVMDGTFGDLMSKQRGRLYHIMAANDSNNRPMSTLDTSGGYLITHNENEYDESLPSACSSSYIKSCSVTAVTIMIFTLMISQIAKVGSYLWLNYGLSVSNDKAFYFGTFALIGLTSTMFHTIQCMILWFLCAVRSAKVLHTELISALMNAPYSFFNSTTSRNLLHKLGADLKAVNLELPVFYYRYLRIATSGTAAIVVIAYSTPFFLLSLIPLGFYYVYIRRHYCDASLRYLNLATSSEERVDSTLMEMIDGAATIRACKQTNRFISDGQGKIADNQRAYFLSEACNRWVAVRAEFLGSLVLFGAALLAVLDVVYGSTPIVDSGLVGLSVYYAMSIPQSFEHTIRLYRDIKLKIGAVEHVKEPVPHEQNDDINTALSATWPAYGRIEFQKYSSETLQNATLTINPGERVSIVGGNISPDLFGEAMVSSGTIDIDGIDIHKISLYELRTRLTVVPSETILFHHCTLRENLDPFMQHGDLDIWEALSPVQLDVHSLDIPIMELNMTKEQQRLFGIARALLRRTRILVIEEADEMDVETDEIVQQILHQQFSGCTRVIITKKLDTVMESDRVLILDQGRIDTFDSRCAGRGDRVSQAYSNYDGSNHQDGYTTVPASARSSLQAPTRYWNSNDHF
ncbi:ABC transporter type 1, transmembrane domain-containing protein [Fennellomyces sp. T-0311]|nr:ABC transporter type 1, transmembrane domain-containing protein [Fennellomyces sp. T-0311]